VTRDAVLPSRLRRSLSVLVATLLVTASAATMEASLASHGLPAARGAGSARALQGVQPDGRAPYARGHVIVGFEPGAGPLQRGAAVASVETRGARRASPLAHDTVVVRLAPGQSVDEAIAEISASPGVAYVEPDYKLYPTAVPDDPYYTSGGQWDMYGTGTTPANRYGSGAGEAWAAGYTGQPTIYVGVVDKGIQITHPDLAANIWTNPGETVNGIDDDGNGYIDDVHGWDFVSEDPSVYDGPADDHGTHVAGTIGARGGNGIGVAGVDWHIGIIPAKFIGAGGTGDTSDAIQAIDYLTALKRDAGLDIVAINASWGGGGASQALLDAIERAGDAGILFVAAAGNDSQDLDRTPSYPASYRCDHRADGTKRGWDCLLSVANIDSAGALNPSSNRGRSSVDLGAPGTNIVSTVPNDDYAHYTGTSMAAPHVTGALALCSSIDPSLTPRQLRSYLLGTTVPTPSLSDTTLTGGRLAIGDLAAQCASGGPLPLSTVRVDDLDPGFERSGSGWRHGWFGKQGHHYWLVTRPGTSLAHGTWRPRLDGSGRYRIQAWIPAQTNLSKRALYRIRTGDGWVSRRLSQLRHRGGWLTLGVFELGASPVIRLADGTGEAASSGRRLVFDTIRLVPTTAPLTVTAAAPARPSASPGPRSSTVPESSAGPGASTPPPDAAATPDVERDQEPTPTVEPGPTVQPSAQPESTPRPEPAADKGQQPEPVRTPQPSEGHAGPARDSGRDDTRPSQAPAPDAGPAGAPEATAEAAPRQG
jgi:subtilisin family serine protease